ncbi:hypothetical protein Scep_022032 [Stephania cephalantha]|uniref:Uncharacterized protein n=1 Tax=Stephania cephalantha TaxID=152367 RepID=A0AAP0FDA5_9MAGN
MIRQVLTQATPDQSVDDEAVYVNVAGECPKGRVYGLGSLGRKKMRYADPGASTSQMPDMVPRAEFDVVAEQLRKVMQLRKTCSHPYLFPGIEPEPYVEGEHLVQGAGQRVTTAATSGDARREARTAAARRWISGFSGGGQRLDQRDERRRSDGGWRPTADSATRRRGAAAPRKQAQAAQRRRRRRRVQIWRLWRRRVTGGGTGERPAAAPARQRQRRGERRGGALSTGRMRESTNVDDAIEDPVRCQSVGFGACGYLSAGWAVPGGVGQPADSDPGSRSSGSRRLAVQRSGDSYGRRRRVGRAAAAAAPASS